MARHSESADTSYGNKPAPLIVPNVNNVTLVQGKGGQERIVTQEILERANGERFLAAVVAPPLWGPK